MKEEDVRGQLRDYIVKELLHGDGRGLQSDSPLLEWGVLESFSMVALLEFVDRQFGVKVPPEQISPDHFQSLDSLTAMVMRGGNGGGGNTDKS